MSEKAAETDTPYVAVAVPSVAAADGNLVVTAKAAGAVSDHYRQLLPEAQGLTWEDDFFDGDDDAGVVAVFDFDYELIEDFRTKVAVAVQAGTLFTVMAYVGFMLQDLWLFGIVVPVVAYGLTLSPCLLRSQVRWAARALHLAVTRDGIRFVQDRRRACWGFSMCDHGKHSKTVPFDKITDCDIVEPAGNACLCIPRVLVSVNVDTASSGGESKGPELNISGLKEPHKFKALVWAMKRSLSDKDCAPRGNYYQAPRVAEMGERKDPTLHDTAIRQSSSGEVKTLLKEIRDELRENNGLLRTIRQDDHKQSSATQEPDATTATKPDEEQGSHREIV